MYFIMHVPMQRLIIPDLWILLSGLLWSWYRIHCRRSLYFCVWMIRWYLNLAQNLKMFQNCLTMLHTTVPTIWMDTALWVSCSAYLSGMGIKYIIFHLLFVLNTLPITDLHCNFSFKEYLSGNPFLTKRNSFCTL